MQCQSGKHTRSGLQSQSVFFVPLHKEKGDTAADVTQQTAALPSSALDRADRFSSASFSKFCSSYFPGEMSPTPATVDSNPVETPGLAGVTMNFLLLLTGCALSC